MSPSTRAALETRREPCGESVKSDSPEQENGPCGQVSGCRTAKTSQRQDACQLHLRNLDPEIAACLGKVLPGRDDGIFAGLVIAGIGLTAGLPALYLVVVKLDLRACRVVLTRDQQHADTGRRYAGTCRQKRCQFAVIFLSVNIVTPSLYKL